MEIAEKVLSIVEKREEEKEVKRLKELEGFFINELKKSFSSYIQNCIDIPLGEIEIQLCNFQKMSKRDFVKLCSILGLKIINDDQISYTGKAKVRVSGTEGEPKTIVQKLIESLNKEIQIEKEVNNNLAKDICEEAFKQLKLGYFDYTIRGHGKYIISLKTNKLLTKKSKYLENQIGKIFEKNGLHNLCIDDENRNLWSFEIFKNS